MENITARLNENLRAKNKQNKHCYQLSLSVGAVWIAHDSNLSMEQLVENADKAMYDNKRSKKLLSNPIVDAGFERSEDPQHSSMVGLRLVS